MAYIGGGEGIGLWPPPLGVKKIVPLFPDKYISVGTWPHVMSHDSFVSNRNKLIPFPFAFAQTKCGKQLNFYQEEGV